MPVTVRLKEIIDALEIQLEESSSFLDPDTGHVETVSNELLREANELLREAEETSEEPDLPAWQKQEWQVARRIVSTGRFLELPSKFEVHEWAIMQDFSGSVESDAVRGDLVAAIHGRGAFGRFKDALRRHGIEAAWYAYRAGALRQIALDWCEENQVAWE